MEPASHPPLEEEPFRRVIAEEPPLPSIDMIEVEVVNEERLGDHEALFGCDETTHRPSDDRVIMRLDLSGGRS